METNDISADGPPPASSSSAASSAPTHLPQQSNPSRQTESTPDSILHDLHSYRFDTDSEFKIGLAVILGHPDTPATEEEVRRNDDLALQAKCFYYSRKKSIQPPIDFSTYKAWLSARSLPSSDSQLSQSTISNATSTSTTIETATATAATSPSPASESATTEPSYPSSFAHVVELITTGQPIPGIQEIPDTVLTGKEAPSTAAKRRKPWEKGDNNAGDDTKDGDQTVEG